MTAYTEAARNTEVLLSEAPGSLSRETITVISGAGALAAGTVLGKITKGAATAALVAGGTGNGTFSEVTVGNNSLVGAYRLIATAATKFNLENPLGVFLGVVTLGTQSTLGGLTFTFTAGGTAHVATDQATITVAAGSGKYLAFDADNLDGTEVADAVLLYSTDATSADVNAVVITRAAELKLAKVVWASTNTAPNIVIGKANLAAKNIIIR
jgi:hypothetical protein